MDTTFLMLIALLLSSCAAQRVIVRDCQKLQGSEGWNCEMIKELD